MLNPILRAVGNRDKGKIKGGRVPLLEQTMKKALVILAVLLMAVSAVFAGGSKEKAAAADGTYPDGTMLIWMTGQPQYRQMYYDGFMERSKDVAPGVKLQVETISTMADGSFPIRNSKKRSLPASSQGIPVPPPTAPLYSIIRKVSKKIQDIGK